MTTVIRVKRCLSEDPVDALVVNCKRAKTDSEENKILIYQRSTTLNNEDNNVSKHVKQFTKCKIENNYKSHNTNIYSKIKLENQQGLKSSRYKIVNLHRPLDTDEDTAAKLSEANITVVDIEATDENTIKEEKSYVYDLYYSDSACLPEIDIKELISVYPLSNDLVYPNECEQNIDTDDSDSNDENNWRNDYPDETDVESITEEDMMNAMHRMDLNEEHELSSDDEDEKFVYSVNEDDVTRFGKMYAKFKAKATEVDSDHSTDDNEYKDY
ncbi:rna polymerase ii nuclear localization protein slc7a6os-related [Holotrichia oblita]|uniref:Rna polymerase ii nuclear localization protein slc7a6os-related n=1 Tax=Holotrichia oblita TaxID=644536 RepID=A0ACB9TDY1_HOLOL|nr:rna polymerase ii nuclear localization protein slc7a6os-related [Holotrichia oblita]